MKIQDKDIYYGVVLSQLAEYPTFTSINKVNCKDGFYQINDDKRILIKYSTADSEWKFTISKDDIERIDFDMFFVLVCGLDTICLLNSDDIIEIVDKESEASQWISISYPLGGQMRVKGSLGELSHVVAHNAFPKDIIGFSSNEEKHAWPPLSQLSFYRSMPTMLFSTMNRRLDLADTLGDSIELGESRNVVFGLKTSCHEWKAWTEKNLKIIEKQIRYDLEFDGFDVEIERITSAVCPVTKKKNLPSYKEFLWNLKISNLE
jgi:hypothetical protein